MGFLTQFGVDTAQTTMEPDMAMTTTTTASSGDIGILIMAMLIPILVISVISYVISAFFMSMIFKKAGVEGWKAWVPGLNLWTFFRLGDQKPWLALLLFAGIIPLIGIIPAIVGLVFYYIACYRIGQKFGRENWFIVLAILLPPVWLIWLAVDKNIVWKGAPRVVAGDLASATPAFTPTIPEVATDVEPATSWPTETPAAPPAEASVATPASETSWPTPAPVTPEAPAPMPAAESSWQPAAPEPEAETPIGPTLTSEAPSETQATSSDAPIGPTLSPLPYQPPVSSPAPAHPVQTPPVPIQTPPQPPTPPTLS